MPGPQSFGRQHSFNSTNTNTTASFTAATALTNYATFYFLNPLQQTASLVFWQLPQTCADYVVGGATKLLNSTTSTFSTDNNNNNNNKKKKKKKVVDHVAEQVQFNMDATQYIDNGAIIMDEDECQRVWYSPDEVRYMTQWYRSPFVFFLEELVGEGAEQDDAKLPQRRNKLLQKLFLDVD
ncbi:hypothetical protein ACA910_010285 [Epithemia clementina (nom. ined.)]